MKSSCSPLRSLPMAASLGLVALLSACIPQAVPAQPTASVVAAATATVLPSATPKPTALPTFTPGPTSEPGVLVVDAAQLLGDVNPLVYGSNAGPWQTITKADKTLIQEAGFTILRFPGGNYVDENAPSFSALDEFIAMCREVGAEPMVEVKLVNSTAKAAADMVTYANITKGYGVKYWSIGNEPSLYWGQRGIDGYDTDTFNAQWREFALAMKAIDPSIQLLGPETHQYTGQPGDAIVDLHYKDWMREFLVVNGDLVDIVSFHRYPFGNFDPFEGELLRSSEEWDKIIPNLRALILATTGKDLPIAVTEVNSNWSNRSLKETTPDTLVNAIWWADAMGRMIEQKVSIVNQFALDGNGGWALLSTKTPRPSYYVYLLYRNFGDQLIFSSSGIAGVSIFSSLRSDGNLALILVNRNTEAVQVPLELRHFAAAPTSQILLLDAGHSAESIASLVFANSTTINLPALSALSITIPPAAK